MSLTRPSGTATSTSTPTATWPGAPGGERAARRDAELFALDPGPRAPGDPRVPAVVRVLPWVLLAAVLAGLSVTVSWAAPFGVVALVVLSTAASRRPVVAAAVVASVVPALSGLQRGGVVPGFKVSELLLVACAVAVFFARPRGWRPLSGVDAAMMIFAVTGAALAVLHGVTKSLEFDELLRSGMLPAFLLLTWWTASRGVASRHDVALVLRWVLLVSLVPALLGVGQYFDVLGIRELIVTVVGDGLMPLPGAEASRITGPFPIAHSFGGYLIVPAVLAAVLVLRGDTRVLSRPWLLLVLAVDMVAVVLAVTVTLVIWVPVAILVAATLVRRLRWALALLAVVTLGALVLFPDALGDRLEAQTTAASGTEDGLVPQTLQYRILVWQRDYLPLLGRAWPVGLGIDTPANVQFEATENQYLTFLLRGGIGLLAAAVLALTAVAVRAWRQARVGDGPERAGAATVAAILVFLPAAAMVWPYVTNAGLPQSLLGFAGAVLALDRWRSRYGRPLRFGPAEMVGRTPGAAPDRASVDAVDR